MTTETITWSGEEWEVIHSSINLGTLKEYANVTLRRKPKPLRERWQVVNCLGEDVPGSSFKTLAEAEDSMRWRNKSDCWEPYSVVHMREVRDE